MTMAKKFSVAAVVVTYNRKELLRECLQALLAQSRPLDEIIVIDNASADGTDQMVHKEFPQVTYVRLPENIGGAGGFHEGMKLAYEKGHDWIWVMDDDACPLGSALESLLNRIRHTPQTENDKVVLYSIYVDRALTRFSEPVSLVQGGKVKSILQYDESYSDSLVEGRGGPFLGLFLSKYAIAKVGLPRKDTFIWGDGEYLYRLREAGYKVYYDFRSILFHPPHTFRGISLPIGLLKLQRPIMRKILFPMGKAWKQYYGIRNSTYAVLRQDNQQRNFTRIIKILINKFLWFSILMVYAPDKRHKLAYACILGIIDGFRGRMGIRLRP